MKKYVLFIIVFIASAAIALSGLIAPKIDDENYSSKKAWEHLSIIAQKPRETGSQHNFAVQKYLADELNKCGIKAQVLMGKEKMFDGTEHEINNIYADLQLSENNSVLFIAHYDSVKESAGAGDNGTSVASLLESAATVANKKYCKTNIKILFTDGEEKGLLGAQSFVKNNTEYLKDVIAIVNAEGFGNGAVMLVQGNKYNNLYFDTVSTPSGYSIISAFQNSLRFDTQIFEKEGIPCLSVATVMGSQNYHTVNDNLDNASFESLQHSLSTVYSMMDNISSKDNKEILNELQQKEKVFFNISYNFTAVYTSYLGIILSVVCVLLFVFYLKKNKIRSVKNIIKAILTVLGIICIYCLMVWLFVNLFKVITWNSFIQIGFDKIGVTVLSIIILTFSLLLCTLIFKKVLKTFNIENMSEGALAVFMLFSIISAFTMPNSAYIIYLPLITLLGVFIFNNILTKIIFVCILNITLIPIMYLCVTAIGANTISSLIVVLYAVFIATALNVKETKQMI